MTDGGSRIPKFRSRLARVLASTIAPMLFVRVLFSPPPLRLSRPERSAANLDAPNRLEHRAGETGQLLDDGE